MSENGKSEEVRGTGSIRPAFTYYHPNAKGTGSALATRAYPATLRGPGFFQFEMSRQKTAGDEERKIFPSFNWKSRIVMKVAPVEMAEMMRVVRGEVSGAKFSHRTDGGSSLLEFEQVETDGRTGFRVSMSHETIAGEDRSAKIVLTASEAECFVEAARSAMGSICFG